ncbi:MAG: potassium transporter TrkG [Acidilobaceae archaeon]
MIKWTAVLSSISALMLVLSILASFNGLVFTILSSDPLEYNSSIRFLLASLTLMLISLLVYVAFKNYIITDITEAYIVVSLYWFLAPLASSIILYASIGLNIIDGFFESLSALSGAGLTVIIPESMPRVILMWRSILQWVGGISIVVIGGALLPFLHAIIRSIYLVEVGARLAPRVISTIRVLFTIYIILTVSSILLLYISGMDLFNALNHGLTGIATAGMSTKNTGYTFWYENGYIIAVVLTIFIMILGATNFQDLNLLIRGKIRAFIDSIEVRGLIAFIAILWLIAFIISVVEGKTEELLPWTFNLVSAITTTGFQIGDLRVESESYKIILVLAMAIGGPTFSTAAGLKVKRVIIAIKAVYWEFSRPLAPPRALRVFRVGDREFTEKDIAIVYSYITLYIIVLIFTSLIIKILVDYYKLGDYTYIDVLLDTTSALSCVGLSTGIISPSTPLVIKLILMVPIYLGRLEFLPIYLLISLYSRRKIVL